MSYLTQTHCVPCEGGIPPLSDNEEEKLHKEVADWLLLRDPQAGSVQVHTLRRQYTFKNFIEAIAFINMIAPLAEKEGHHPDIYIFYNKVQLDLFTHAVGGLSENDFILAAKIDKLLNS